MDNTFAEDERLFRAVIPDNMYWKDGRPTSAAFKTRETDGLSTDRQGERTVEEAVAYLHSHLKGSAVSVTYNDCCCAGVDVVYSPVSTPEDDNPYHTLLQGIKTKGQARALAQQCMIHD